MTFQSYQACQVCLTDQVTIPSPQQTYGNWNWPARPPDHSEKHSYGYHPSGPPNGYGTNRPYYPVYNTNSHDSTAVPPPEGRRTQSEKKVHFDYGQDHGPAADHARYTDSHGGPAAYPKEDHRSRDNYYSAGMSDWYASHPGRHPERSGYEYSYRPYEIRRWRLWTPYRSTRHVAALESSISALHTSSATSLDW